METRPDLPLAHANSVILESIVERSLHPVKYQLLKCQGKEILVGRLKVETGIEPPEEKKGRHAFILRRYDTDAISLTTMFRAAFPTAGDKEEKLESQWVKEHYNLSGNNGSPNNTQIPRLAGTWISCNDALHFADEYGLTPLIEIITKAQPDEATLIRLFKDPNHLYWNTVKKRGNELDNSNSIGITKIEVIQTPQVPSRTRPVNHLSASNSNGSLPTPSPTLGDANPNPSKKRREASPAISVHSTASPKPTRRPIRVQSPAPPSLPPPPASAKLNKVSVSTPSSSPKGESSSPANQSLMDDSEIARTASDDLHQEDLEEQTRLIQRLVAEKEAKEAARRKQEENAEQEGEEEASDKKEEQEDELSSSKKRTRKEGEPEFEFNFKEPEVGERPLATNRRVGFKLRPQTKSVAWGVAAFAVGMGAISLLPNFM